MKTTNSKNNRNLITRLITLKMLVVMLVSLQIVTAGPGDKPGKNQNQSKSNPKTMETQIKKAERINGFSMEDIVGTVQVLQNDPELAKFQFRARNKWIKGGHNRSTIQDFYGAGQDDESRKKPFVFDNSEPPVLLGNNEGANPVEFILHGLAGCMTTTMVLHAAANKIELESVESRLEGDLDVQGFLGLNDEVRNGYQQIRINFEIKGDLTDEQKQQLESFVRKSPVYDIVTNQVPVQVSLNY